MNWNPGPAAPETNISNFPFNEREIKNVVVWWYDDGHQDKS